MQTESTPGAPAPAISREGIVFVTGYASSLRVERGHLIVKTGEGRHIQETRFPRVSRPRLRRVMIHGKGRYTRWSALEWIEGVGASFAFISRDAGLLQPPGRQGRISLHSGGLRCLPPRDAWRRRLHGAS
jgi:hypothetical protein